MEHLRLVAHVEENFLMLITESVDQWYSYLRKQPVNQNTNKIQ